MVFKKLPRSVKVKDKVYTISYTQTVEKGELAGRCFHDQKKMDIAMDQIPEEVESTVIHEILHAISYEYKFPLSESKVLKLEQALYEVFKQNGWRITLTPRKKPQR